MFPNIKAKRQGAVGVKHLQKSRVWLSIFKIKSNIYLFISLLKLLIFIMFGAFYMSIISSEYTSSKIASYSSQDQVHLIIERKSS